MKVKIPIDDLDEYATEEDETTDLSFSLGYLKKNVCLIKLVLWRFIWQKNGQCCWYMS